MSKVAFFHGLESKPVSDKSKAIQNMFTDTYIPAMDYRRSDMFDEVLNQVKERGIDLLVGSSMGGWFAYCISTLTGIPTVLFNPAVQGRSFEPNVKMGSKSAKHTVVLGKKDNLIIPEKTVEWFDKNGAGNITYNWESNGHRTPNNIFTKYVGMYENENTMTEKQFTLFSYQDFVNEMLVTERKVSPYERETLLMYKKEYEQGKEIPFGVKTSLIAQGMIAREGGPNKGEKVKSPEYGGPKEGHEIIHYSEVWEKDNEDLQENGYFKGISASTARKKEDLMKKQAAMPDDDPEAYKELPGDTKGKKLLKKSQHTKDYEELYKNDESLTEEAEGDRSPIDSKSIEKGLKTKSEETGVPLELLRIVMRRGMAAWKSGHKPGAGQEQWGYARLNSFLTKAPGTWGRPIDDPKKGGPKGAYGADADVAQEVIKGGYDKKLKEE